MHRYPSFVRLGLIVLALATLVYTYSTWTAEPVAASDQPYQTFSPLAGPQFATETELRLQVSDIDYLGMTTFETGYTSSETEVGGLSGIVYDKVNGFYTVLSDDRSQRNPARAYNLTIDLDDGSLDDGDVVFASLVSLEDENEEDFPENSIDPEGFAQTSNFRFFIASESNLDSDPALQPFIREFSFVGAQLEELTLPEKYLPQADGSRGLRTNLGFESLAVSPNQRYLYAATENALAQDGPIASLESGSPARILQYDLATRTPIHEFLYMVEAIPQDSDPAGGFADNGLVDLQPLDNNGTFLAMERSYAEGVGNTIRLYIINLRGATDIMAMESLQELESSELLDLAVEKELIVDLAEFGIQPDNVEGMAFGPTLDDGRQTLILVSDNNFNETQITQFIGLALSFDAVGVVASKAETAQLIDSDPANGDVPEGSVAGTAGAPAIWVHPTEAARSLVFAALEEGGLAIFGLNGNTLATIPPESYGTVRYDGLAIVYDYTLGEQSVDLVIAADGANDTLVIFAYEPVARTIEDVTGEALPALFGETAADGTYEVAAYQTADDETPYLFVTQGGSDQVLQLALTTDDSGQVGAAVVRTLTLPTLPADLSAEDAAIAAHGLAVDQEMGYLYAVAPDGTHILKYRAAASAGDAAMPIRTIHDEMVASTMNGLSIYYGADGYGYLVTAIPGESSYALFERSGDNQYVGSFAVGEVATDESVIDQTNGTHGLDVVSTALGGQYPAGLLVVQDQMDIAPNSEGGPQTNFKFVPWETVAAAFAPALPIDTEGYQYR